MTAGVVRRINFGVHGPPLHEKVKRILIIRGGAIGDFILTLPALKALRDAEAEAYVEILGYKHIAALAENRFYAQAVRSIEYGPFATFFAKESTLPHELVNYFASFDLIISYLHDPDRIFEDNIRRCGTKKLIRGPARIGDSEHAARQLARPIEALGIKVVDLAARIFPSAEDRQFAREFLRHLPRPLVAIHPSSGSKKKNWPIENWVKLVKCADLSASTPALIPRSEPSKGATGRRTPKHPLVVISGEADQAQAAELQRELEGIRFAKNLALPQLAGLLENLVFIGHDSGISHLAAGAGAHCILLFGPTDPAIWAPLNLNVRAVRAPDGDLQKLDVDVVLEALDQELMRIGIST